jgi:hypothetical protein
MKHEVVSCSIDFLQGISVFNSFVFFVFISNASESRSEFAPLLKTDLRADRFEASTHRQKSQCSSLAFLFTTLF